ncbi:MAG: VWA domain-containing protein [Rikenellaceae bacterium]
METSKAEAVAQVANMIISELIERARRSDGVRDYYDIAVLGYSGDGVFSEFSQDGKSEFISVTELAKREPKVVHSEQITTDASGRMVRRSVKRKRWIEAKASGETPMYEAMCYLYDAANNWISKNKNRGAFYPIIYHITDGETTDCCHDSILDISNRIKSLRTDDGEALLINIHITSNESVAPLIFPTEEELKSYDNRYAQLLAASSSDMPEIFDAAICDLKGVSGQSGFKGVSFNASVAELLTILSIGSISVKIG